MDKYFICVNMGKGFTREFEVLKNSFIEFIGFYEDCLHYDIKRWEVSEELIIYFTDKMYLGRIQYIKED